MRNVILHLHIFKNAGSSIDFCLRKSFPNKWGALEGEEPWSVVGNEDVLSYLTRNPEVQAISSHQARPFFANSESINIVPIIFLRNPIDRARSCYDFERKQEGVYPSARAAQRGICYYIDFSLDMGNPDRINAFTNYQTLVLSSALDGVSDARKVSAHEKHLHEAMKYIDKLSFFGVVEEFSSSISCYEKNLKQMFPTIQFQEMNINEASNRENSLFLRINKLKEALGSKRFERLMEANILDINLYEFAYTKFHQLLKQ